MGVKHDTPADACGAPGRLEQNAEMELLRRQLAAQTEELTQLRGLVGHVDDV